MPPVERPILMNPDSMRGLMDNRKRQTRRLLKPQPQMLEGGRNVPWRGDPAELKAQLAKTGRFCPHGQPGDLLWTRETWRPLCRRANPAHRSVLVDYQAGGQLWMPCPDPDFQVPPWWKACLDPWRPSVFLPRWASRALLEVVDVRLERVQQISFDDCLAEGVMSTPFWGQDVDWPALQADQQRPRFAPPSPEYDDDGTDQGWMDYARGIYMRVWDSINKARGQGWQANPWVWVIAFKVLELHGRPRPDFAAEALEASHLAFVAQA